MRESERAYVYFIQVAPETYKVGVSVDLQRRLVTLSKGRDYQLKLRALIPAMFVRHDDGSSSEPALEGKIHRLLSGKRLIGEWFRLTGAELQSVLLRFNGYEVDLDE